MTSVTLHPTPTYRTVARTQMRAVGLILRKEAIIFLAVLVGISVLLVWSLIHNAGHRHDNAGATLSGLSALLPFLLPPFSCIGLIAAFGIWRSEEPARRSYLWAMPVNLGSHTLIKVLSGWIWLMAAVVIELILFYGLSLLISYMLDPTYGIHSFLSNTQSAWMLAMPFAATTILYLLISLVTVGSDHPWRWLIRVAIAFMLCKAGFLVLQQVGSHTFLPTGQVQPNIWGKAGTFLEHLVSGNYGIKTALYGMRQESLNLTLTATPNGVLARVPDITPPPVSPAIIWVRAMSLWLAISVAGVCAIAYRRVRTRVA